MLQLSDNEKETIILTTEADHNLTISTYNGPLKQQLRQLKARNPAVCSLLYHTAEGRETYQLVKAWAAECFLPLLQENKAA